MVDRSGQRPRPKPFPIALGLRAKITTGLLTIALLVVAVGGVGIWANLRIKRQAELVSRYSGPALLAAEQMITEALRLQSNALEFAALSGRAGNSADGLLESRQGVFEARAAFLEAAERHASLFGRGEAHDDIPLHDDATTAFERYYAAVLDLLEANDPETIPHQLTRLASEEAQLLGILEALFNNESDRLIASQQMLADNASQLVLLITLVIVTALALALLIALRTSAAITNPLGRLQAAAVQVGRGEYLSGGDDPLSGIDSRDEIGSLARAFRGMSSDLKQLTDDLHHSANHDMLTGLANRKGLIEHLEDALGRSRDRGETSALLFMDIDRFKAINDFHGHSVGDELLVVIGTRLRSCLRDVDLVARLGGDEFTVLIERADDTDAVLDLTQRLLDALGRPFFLLQGEIEVRMSASTGVVMIDAAFADTTDILRAADLAMYQAKAQGEGRFELYTEELRAAAMSTMRLETDLRKALERGELNVHYQPIVRSDDHTPIGLEALARWIHPELGFIPPDRFIPIAEEAGLILDLDRAVLRQACRQVAEWNARLGRELSVSVNLSGRQFASATLIDAVRNALADTGLPPHLLHLEITETVLMQRNDQTQTIVQQLRWLGVALHMDDFGTGYSSLAYLQLFDVDALKIDRTFVSGMLESRDSATLVSTMLTMAKALRLKVVAEGVETEAQSAHLQRLGCDFLQGYLISKPLPAGDMTAVLEARLQPPAIPTSLAAGTET